MGNARLYDAYLKAKKQHRSIIIDRARRRDETEAQRGLELQEAMYNDPRRQGTSWGHIKPLLED